MALAQIFASLWSFGRPHWRFNNWVLFFSLQLIGDFNQQSIWVSGSGSMDQRESDERQRKREGMKREKIGFLLLFLFLCKVFHSGYVRTSLIG